MAISRAKKQSRGRPRVDATPVNVRIPPDQLAGLDKWIQKSRDHPSRPEAIRQLLEHALANTASTLGTRSKEATVKASTLARRELERAIPDDASPPEEQERRKRRLLKGPKEFRDIRNDVRT